MPRALALRLAVVGLVISTALTVILGRRLDRLSRSYTELQRLASSLHAGSAVPTFKSAGVLGEALTVGERPVSTGRQLLFVMTTTCPYCRATMPVWQQLADSVRRVPAWNIEPVAIALDSLAAVQAFVATTRPSFPVTTFPATKLKLLYRALRVPQTILLNHEGRVLYVHAGVFTGSHGLDSLYGLLAP